jgi:hypothetical protein
MKKQKLLHRSVILTVLLQLAFFWGCGSEERENVKITLKQGKSELVIPMNYSPIPQEETSRKWMKIRTKLDLKIGGISDTIFSYPIEIDVNEDGEIFVLDMKDYSVKKLSPSGKLLQKYGRYGKGPGEFVNPNRLAVFNGKVAVGDINARKIVVFDDGETFDIPFQLHPMDISFIDEDNIAALQLLNPLDYSCVRKMNYKTEKLSDFENIIDQENTEDLALGMLPFLNGKLSRYEGKTLYVPNVLPYFFKFSEEGKLEGVFNTIDKSDRVSTGSIFKNMVRFPHPKNYFSNDMGVMDDKLFLLSNKARQKKEVHVIDFYSIEDGSYQFSFKFSEVNSITDIVIREDKMYIIKDKIEVKVFDFEILGEA